MLRSGLVLYDSRTLQGKSKTGLPWGSLKCSQVLIVAACGHRCRMEDEDEHVRDSAQLRSTC